jgi:uncharacterized membrane protein YfcA
VRLLAQRASLPLAVGWALAPGGQSRRPRADAARPARRSELTSRARILKNQINRHSPVAFQQAVRRGARGCGAAVQAHRLPPVCLSRRVRLPDIFVLLGAGVLAGIASTVASLASVVSYPVLLALGLPPVSANVTNTVALVFTGAGAAAGSRQELAGQGTRLRRLGVVTALGGGCGAALLLLSPASTFQFVAPCLIGAASVLLIVQPMITGLTARPSGEHSRPLRAALFAVAVYVGYFGAAGGILMLAVLSAMLDQALPRINAVKNVVSGLANAAAAAGFALFGPVRWSAAVPLAAGFLLGGWIGPALVRRLPARALRVAIGACGLILAVALGSRTYR